MYLNVLGYIHIYKYIYIYISYNITYIIPWQMDFVRIDPVMRGTQSKGSIKNR